MATVLRTLHVHLVLSCLLLTLGGLWSAERLDVDVIVLSNGHQITGRVTSVDDQQITVKQDHGVVQLPRILVTAVHLGFASRIQRLDRTDYEAVITLAQWAKERGLYTEAQDLALLAWSMPGRDARGAILMAQLLDAQNAKQREALTYYREWRDTFGGDNPEILQRIEMLENHFNSYEAALKAHRERLAEAQTNHVEGLESRGGWQGDDPRHANPVSVEARVIDDSGITNTVLEVRYSGGAHDKATLRRRVTFDGNVHQQFTVEVYNSSDKALPISLAVKAGPEYEYNESPAITVPPQSGWFPISFSFQANDWKNANSNWSHSATVQNVNNIRELQLLFHNHGRDGAILVDNIPLLR